MKIAFRLSKSADQVAVRCLRPSRPSRRTAPARAAGILCSVTAALLLVAAPAAAAQEKRLEIGVLALGPRNVPAWRCGPVQHQVVSVERRRETMPFYVLGLRDELEKLKYVEDRPENAGRAGRRFLLDLRMGTVAQLREHVREFIRKPVDIIVAVASVAVQIAKEETRDHPLPILMTGVSNPVEEKYVESLARPGGFITGVSHQLVQGSAKRVELFKEMVPGLQRMVTMRRPGYAPSEKSMMEIRAAADRLKIALLDQGVTSRQEMREALQKTAGEGADGIMVLPDSLIISNVDLIIEKSLEQRIPTFGLQDFMADWGGFAAYGPSAYQAGSRVASYVDKISNGAKPGDLPVEPIDPTFVINLKAAECDGISLPLSVLHQADRVIR